MNQRQIEYKIIRDLRIKIDRQPLTQLELMSNARILFYGVVAFALALFLIAGCAGEATAAEIPEETAIHCIMGEARLDYVRGDKDAFKYHAEALRNRGTTKGVYGCKARWGRSEKKYQEDVAYCKLKGLFEIAKQDWRNSKYTNYVKGAKHWGSLTIDKEWIVKMEKSGYVLTAKTKGAAFYLARSN